MPDKLCSYKLHDNCLNIADSSDFVGKCCKVCLINKNQIYYQTKREDLIKRAKERQLKTYVHKRPPKTQE